MPRRSSLLALTALALPLVGYQAPARAQATSDITMEVRVQKPGDTDFTLPAQQDLDAGTFFNRVRCECDAEFEVRFRLAEGADASTLDGQQVDILLGDTCDDVQFRPNCFETPDPIADFGDLTMTLSRIFTVRELVALDPNAECPTERGTNNVFALVDVEGDGTFESDSTLPIVYDTQPPDFPDNLTLDGGEEAVIIDFDRSESNDDLFQFQVLCAATDAPDTPVFDDPDAPAFTRVQDIDGCGSDFSIPVEGADTNTPAALLDLDPDFICGTSDSSSGSIRVDRLDNDTTYHIMLVAVDKAGNARATYLGTAQPRPAVDFWELYKSEGGQAEGGCQSGGGASLWLALLVAGVLVGLRRRARRRGYLGALVALVGIGLAPAVARAQPYWNELEEPVPAEAGPPVPAWNFGLKLGPYTPDIDSEFSGEGPFERTFGDKAGLMAQIELERFFFYPLGQLGLSAMVGYHHKSAKAFEDDGGELKRIEQGEKTGFSLVPMSLSVVYRLTAIDEHTYVPVVPYAKLGLAYYYWWITRPSGDIAETPDAGKGRGGSLGWQGSIGLAVRAEKFDDESRLALRNELGIEHAGFYVEANLARVDGFGSDDKLSVGDLTWFGGVNFEF